jgi:RHS repeat-associated protein
LLIDATNGSVSGNYSFSAYGEEKISGDVVSPWRYSGKRIDDETGLVFFGKRYYDPVIGRWLTKDPLGTPEGPNRYAYALNNPMSNIDEYGLYSFSDLIHSFWKGVQTLGSYSLHSFDTFKYNVSFIDYIRPHFDKVAQDIVGRTPLHLAGFYQDASECGVHGKGELHDKVRITLMNGILNARIDYKNTINFISDCHGGINVHYIFDATEGWSWDIFKAIAAKFGYVSPQAHMLADTWKAMIDEMGGVDGGGLIMHFAHSVGGTHTQAALSLLTPEELKMIRITTFGSATLVDYPGVESITNFISKRDGVPYLDPIKYVQALLGLNNNTLFVGSWLGIPFIDHTLGSSTYYLLIELLGQRFLDDYHLQ